MELLVRIAALCLACAVVASLLKSTSPEAGLLLAAAAAITGAVLLASSASELAELFYELRGLTGLAPGLFEPLIKATAIALTARVCSSLCDDAGQSALSRLTEAAGAVCALTCSVPLVRALTELVSGWLYGG